MALGGSTKLIRAYLTVNKQACLVTLTKSHLLWEKHDSKHDSQMAAKAEVLNETSDGISTSLYTYKTIPNPIPQENQCTINLKDIIAVKKGLTLPRSNKAKYIELTHFKTNTFCIHYVNKLNTHKWKNKTLTVECGDASVWQEWMDTLQTQIDSPELAHPKNLLVFVNPVGGRQKGPKIYSEKVAPLFQLAGIHTEVMETQYAGHAENAVKDLDLSKLDGIVSVGGDGMFAEITNGILRRTMADEGSEDIHYTDDIVSPNIHLGIIPAGSTDTVAFTTMGVIDPVTAALHIIVGNSISVDTCGVYGKDKQLLRFGISMVAFGFYGDTLADSDKHRWMGPKRYDWSGFKKFVSNRAYEGTISFVRSEESGHPQDNTRCYSGCSVCASDSDTSSNVSSLYDASEWEHLTGSFLGINTFTIPCKTGLSPEGVAPSCHLGDGYTDLVIVKKASRTKFLRHLLRIAHNTANQFDFDFIEAIRVKAFRYHANSKPSILHSPNSSSQSHQQQEPQQSRRSTVDPQQSVWNCDGEVIEETDITVRVHRQAIKIFATGVEDPNIKSDTCTSCYGKSW